MNTVYKISEEQQKILNESLNNLKVWVDNFGKVMNQILKDKVKPIVDRIKTLLKNKPRIKIKYKPITLMTVNSYMGINKPKRISCRSNC